MTETIDSANAAASTLFLGHNGDWWDSWMIVSLIAVALAAIAAGVTTAGSIVSHKREAVAAEIALDRFKIETDERISESGARAAEANARAEEAKLALEKYKRPRSLDTDSFLNILKQSPPAKAEVLYVRECSDCSWTAQFIGSFLNTAGWTAVWAPIDEKKAAAGPWRLQPIAVSVKGYPWGITVVAKDITPENLQGPKGASIRALFDGLFASYKPSVTMAFDDSLSDDLIRVVVAPKP